ncbi:D-alanyl-D-alanine carboxypeptidase family protein [Sphingomicrobium astaxanthinifaciens]|uniref:D-alanyl-D-alanine carboxypeptidase family protein n=1 Tax=Sphingomicrobium astaxanthinifaciens TaxID=1227949 RepID=UPI001FCA6BC4|nr:D-alanyl-D-alanine carboxypeptidase family protein [Sphingomicrobium astaxanthinifaciens]MCJ7422403.1 D-alanyl-D-alanine carboxypeptidase [Sphingomicrobium astaxanthinifaciens]
MRLSLLPIALLPAAALASPSFDGAAPIAYLIDLSSGQVLYEKDADRQIPPASMAKMMTTHVAFELIDAGKLDEDKMCRVRPETWREWSGPQAGSTMFLSPGEEVSVENLLYGVVTVSGNDATMVLAECISGTVEAFVDRMNAAGDALGLEDSRFGNPVGWPDEGATLVTARDLATLARSTIEDHPDLYRKYYGKPDFTWGETQGGQPITQPNRNPLFGKVPGADGLKTGHTEEAGYGFTGSAERDGRRLIMVIAGLDSYGARVSESVALMEWGFNAWDTMPLFAEGAEVARARVQLGSADSVALVAPRDLAASFPAGLAADPSAKVRYAGPLKAPIAKGEKVAELVVTVDGEQAVLPLVAGADVEEAGFFRRALIGLKQLFGMA